MCVCVLRWLDHVGRMADNHMPQRILLMATSDDSVKLRWHDKG